MRRFEEGQDREFGRSVALGEDNAECLRQMERWCKHVEIERVSEGLYAQMTGLPIASHSIGCPYVEGRSHSMNLRWIFCDFLVQHCAACPYHTPNGDVTWGQKIIDDHRKEILKCEQTGRIEAERISGLRSDLRLRSKNISANAAPESLRILEFLEAIFSDDEIERKEASERLKQSARLGPDLFPDGAIDLILALAGSAECSHLILPVCAELSSRRADLNTRLAQTALDNIDKNLHVELSATVLEALGDAIRYPIGDAYIERLLLSQDHRRPFDGWQDGRPDYSHSTRVIIRSFDADPENVQNVLRRELKNETDYVRFQLCGAIQLIQRERPQIVANLLDDLVASLAFYENERLGDAPSGQIIQILRTAFRHFPEYVDQFLAEVMARVHPTVQEDIVRVYRDQFFDRTVTWEKRREDRHRAEVSEPEQAAIQRLLEWVKNDQLDIDIRAEALEALAIACKYATAGVLNHFDSLFGYIAIVSGQKRPDPPSKILLPNRPQSAQLDQLDELRRTQQWGIFKQRLQNCLEELCEARPSDVFDSVYSCLNQSSAHLEDDFKACCVSLLGELGKDYLLRPRVLPLIWRALMDYGSTWIQATAIRATVEMFSYSTASPPTNLVDTIILHLQDPHVVVHKAALRAVSWRPGWFDERQSREALTCLSSHLRAYRDDKYQLDDICDGILSVGRRYDRLKLLALRLVESVFPTGEELVDSKIAEQMTQFCKPNERIAQLVAKDIGICLARHDRDHLNYYGHSPRGHVFEWLHQLPVATYGRVADDLLASAKAVAERDAFESCHFASLFSHFRAFRYEQSVLEAAANALSQELRFESVRATLLKLAAVAAGNASLQTSDATAPQASLTEV
jgi:hypothetical protein